MLQRCSTWPCPTLEKKVQFLTAGSDSYYYTEVYLHFGIVNNADVLACEFSDYYIKHPSYTIHFTLIVSTVC